MNIFQFGNLAVYNSIYKYIDSNMFIIIENNEALVFDPHKNEDVLCLFKEKDVNKVTILLTHEHSDHVSGIWWFLENYACTLICSEKCALKLSNPRSVRPLLLSFVLEENDRKNGTDILSDFRREYVIRTYKADIIYSENYLLHWMGHELRFKSIQGHSPGSSFIVLDNKYVFTGDSLLKNYPVIVSFPYGDKKSFINQSIPYLEKNLSSDMIILPGHGNPFLLCDIMKEGKIHVELR